MARMGEVGPERALSYCVSGVAGNRSHARINPMHIATVGIRMSIVHKSLIALILLSCGACVSADPFCSTSAVELRADLLDASSNGQDDVIKVTTGLFEFADATQCQADACFEAKVTDGMFIQVSGGWNDSCTQQSIDPAARTVLSGSGARRALYIDQSYANFDFEGAPAVRNLDLINGVGPAFGNGGCGYFSNTAGDLYIEKVSARGCISPGGRGGGVFAEGKKLYVRDSLFAHNIARWGAGLYTQSATSDLAYITNNTVAANESQGGTEGSGGIHAGGAGGAAYLSNNIVYGNTTTNRFDVGRDGVTLITNNNLYGTSQFPMGGAANVVADPKFECVILSPGIFCETENFRLSLASPARNAGWNSPPGGISSFDLDGKVRLSNQSVDLGAYESDSSFKLSVALTGNGSGKVSSTPGAIDCLPLCSANFTAGSMVQLVASASAGSLFTGWSGACAGSGSTCFVPMTAARLASANFAASTAGYPLTIEIHGEGTVEIPATGESCGQSSCEFIFAAGTQVVLEASPATGEAFEGWSSACSGLSPCVVTMDGARLVEARFTFSDGFE